MATCRKDDGRLDWMYGSGMQAKQDAEKRKEDMLMGKVDVVVPQEKQQQEVSRVSRVGVGVASARKGRGGEGQGRAGCMCVWDLGCRWRAGSHLGMQLWTLVCM